MLHVAVARIPTPASIGADAAPRWLGASERQRWAGLSPAARRAFAASRALLRGLLRAATGVAEECWDVSAQPGAAPVARTLGREDAGGAIHVSLSHRLDWVAAAVGRVPVGVDLECAKQVRSDPRERAELMLSPAELAQWRALAPDELEPALLTRWTAKEAWFKASPPGLAAWDFRRVAARACAPADANVRTWAAPPLHLALCCADAHALAAVDCEGLASESAPGASWHLHPVACTI